MTLRLVPAQPEPVTSYRVRWDVDIDDVPSDLGAPEAARRAFALMQKPRDPADADAAVVFDVIDTEIYDRDWQCADSIDLALLTPPPQRALEQAQGVMWCTTHHGIINEDDTRPICDMHRGIDDGAACSFYALYYHIGDTPLTSED